MKSKTTKRRLGALLVACALSVPMGLAVAAPAQAACSGAYMSVNTSAQAAVKVGVCTGGSTVRAHKDWTYTDAVNSPVGSSVGPWIGSSSLTSIANLPSGRFHKANYIDFA
jgi:hypothetical protein